MQSLKKLFANNTAQQAGNSRAAVHVEDEEIEMDPEYATKRALTTKVKQQVYCILKFQCLGHGKFFCSCKDFPSLAKIC